MFKGHPFHVVSGAHHHRKRQPDATCATGGFYKSPTAGQTLNISTPVNITWDTTCLNTTAVDIYLHAPGTNKSVIQMFQKVYYPAGNYQAPLKAKWWNSTSSVNLELVIVPTGTLEVLSTIPPGPIWHVNYTAPAGASTATADTTTGMNDADITVVDNIPGDKHSGPSKGAIAAAVLVPLIVIGLAVAFYIRYTRVRETSRRKRWSEAVDKRMSTISVEWKSMTVRGAEAAARASVRSSVVGGFRPSSTYAVEADDGNSPEMSQIRRPGVGMRGPVPSTASASRQSQSRISFAADTRFSRNSTYTSESGARARPSGEGRRAGVPSRAFHSAYIPPVPTIETDAKENGMEGVESDDTGSGAMSPTQRDGPLALSAADIRARVHNLHASENEEPRPSIDEITPALSMMRTGTGNDSHAADLLIEPKAKQQPTPLNTEIIAAPPTAVPKSPIVDAMPMQPMHTGMMMSPDDMLRVYAERRRTGTSTTTSNGSSSPVISFPMPVASPVSPVGRPLYTGAAGGATSTNPFTKNGDHPNETQTRRSNETYYDDEDAYFGTAA